jgi:hypothetical protein
MHNDEQRLALMFRQDGTRLDPMWIPGFKRYIEAWERRARPVVSSVCREPGWDQAPRRLSFAYSLIQIGNVVFYLEDGEAKTWTSEIAVTAELLSDVSVDVDSVILDLALPKDAIRDTARIWCMRVLDGRVLTPVPSPARVTKYDTDVRLWLCGSAVKR